MAQKTLPNGGTSNEDGPFTILFRSADLRELQTIYRFFASLGDLFQEGGVK